MSHTEKSSTKLTRRTVLAGSAASVAVAGLAFGVPGSAVAAIQPELSAVEGRGSSELCVAHHKELSQHLKSVLNSAYVDENMKNKMLSTSHCPHCKVGLAPDMLTPDYKDKAAFSTLT